MVDTEALADPVTQRALFAQVRRHTGIVMADRKWTLLHGRLRRRLQALELSSYRDYLAVLDSSTEEVGHFIDLVTTNEAALSLEGEEQAEAYAEIARQLVVDKVCPIPMYVETQNWGISESVSGYNPRGDEFLDLSTVTIAS